MLGKPPHASQPRILQIDALRGFALFGILLVNIFVFHAPYFHYGPFYYQFTGVQLKALSWMIDLCAGKFMFIYAFLFGYGCWMQYEKFAAPALFHTYWNQRMWVLAGFGMLHVLLLSFGDILLPYALLGLSLPFLLRYRNRTLLLLALVVYLVPVYEFVLRAFMTYPSIFDHTELPLETYIQVNGEGNFWQMFKLRMHDYWSFKNEKAIIYIPKEWSLFLVGIVAARYQLATRLTLRKAIAFCLVALLGVVLMHMYKSKLVAYFDIEHSVWQRTLVGLLIQSAEFAHGMFYIIAFWLAWQVAPTRKILTVFTYPGKLSLTNYIMQSLICVMIFSGLGWYAAMTPVQLIVLAMLIFVGQVIFSYLWLRHHAYGPLETLWRKLSRKPNNTQES